MNTPTPITIHVPIPPVTLDYEVWHEGRWCCAATLPNFDANKEYIWRVPVVFKGPDPARERDLLRRMLNAPAGCPDVTAHALKELHDYLAAR